MQNFIFRFGIVSVIIAGGFLVVCAFAFPGFFATSASVSSNGQQNSPDSRTRNGCLKNIDMGATDVPKVEYDVRLARIAQFLDAGNFQALVKERDEIEDVWGAGGGERYAKLILEVISSFGDSRILHEHPEANDLRDKYATAALARSDSYGIESEVYLARNLRHSAFVPSFTEAEASKLRKSSKMWLHLLTRLECDRDPSFDLNKALANQPTPPEDPRFSGVVDPVAKARFQTAMAEYIEQRKRIGYQYKLLNMSSDLAEPWGTKFLANVYSRPPFSREPGE